MKKIRKIFFQVAVVPVVLAVLFAGGASAFSEADLQKLKTTGSCSSCDLRGALLSGTNLSNATLSNANLRSINLSSANLSTADLRNSDLHNANLRNANLRGADLRGATLSGATWRDGSKCQEGSVGRCNK